MVVIINPFLVLFACRQAGIKECDKSVGDILYAVSTLTMDYKSLDFVVEA